MNKLILFLSFLALGFLTVLGSINPDNAAVWLSSQSQNMDYFRIGVMAILASLLVTTPPRQVVLRMVVGVSSVAIIVLSAYQTYQNVFQLFDGLALLAAGIASLVAALEFNSADDPLTVAPAKAPKQKAARLKYSTHSA